MLKVRRVSNGFIVQLDEACAYSGRAEEVLFPIDKSEKIEDILVWASAFHDVLCYLIDYFAMGGSEYDEKRLCVSWKKGEKYPTKEKTKSKQHER